MTVTVGVFGLGSMGGRMAATLARAGFPVWGLDPSPAAAGRAGPDVRVGDSAGDLFRACDVLLLSLPGSTEVEAVLTGGDGLLDQGLGHRLVVDTSTSNPLSTRALAERLTAAGHGLVDAPVSGGPLGAESGSLTAFVGGSDDAVTEASPVLHALSRAVIHVGPSGAGNVAKLVNNLLCASHLQIAGEALRLMDAAGLAPGPVLEAVNQASGRSAVSEVNLPRWVLSSAFDSGFTIGLMSRDVSLAVSTAEQLGLSLPMASLTERSWQSARERFGAAEDFNRVADPAAPAYWDARTE